MKRPICAVAAGRYHPTALDPELPCAGFVQWGEELCQRHKVGDRAYRERSARGGRNTALHARGRDLRRDMADYEKGARILAEVVDLLDSDNPEMIGHACDLIAANFKFSEEELEEYLGRHRPALVQQPRTSSVPNLESRRQHLLDAVKAGRMRPDQLPPELQALAAAEN